MTVFPVTVQTVPLAVASDFQMPAAATSQDEIEMGNVRELLLVITLAATCPASAQAAAWTHSPADDRIGRIYYYERSNTDGSLDERITVFRRDATRLEVYKENGLCRNAALVTADLDLTTLSAPRITGGALQADARYVEFAFLEADPAGETLNLLVQLPEQEIRNEAPLGSPHWTLFDFDLASLTVATPHIDARRDGFEFGMALLWADPAADDPLVWMGDVKAHFEQDEPHLGARTERYRLTGSAFEGQRSTGSDGTLWLDAAEGHIVDAVMPAPNHPGYTDFRIRLMRISDGGETEWTELLRAHFADCE